MKMQKKILFMLKKTKMKQNFVFKSYDLVFSFGFKLLLLVYDDEMK